MTREDIIPSRTDVLSMAREADREWDCDRDMVEWLEWFATLVATASASVEREACAKVCEELLFMVSSGDEHMDGVLDCLAAIRARGETASRGQA